MKENKKTLIISLVAFLLVVIAGVSYAYFSAIINGSESESTITMDAGELSITYSDNSNELNVTALKIYPREEEWITKEFKVTANNTTELAMYYKINLVIDNNEFRDSLTYTLESENTSGNGSVVPAVSNMSFYGISGYENLEYYGLLTNNVTFGTGYFTGGENQEHKYTLKIYFKDNGEDQNEYQKAKFAAHIEIEGTGSVKAEPDGWSNAASGTLLAGIKANYSTPSVTLTSPGKEVSSEEEAVMAAAADDYGTSYYFRGNVQNNYVAFAGMCWRIVRVTGDGSIKLVLYNYNSTDCTETGDYLINARDNNDEYIIPAFNSSYNNNAYIGFMYGSATGTDYGTTHANENKSTILTNLETWYTNNIATYADNLADTIWCNDKSTYGSYTGTGTAPSIYNSSFRMIRPDPSLICPNDNDGGKLSKFTVEDTTYGNGDLDYKIGLLTVDEIAYAGFGIVEENPNSNYLKDNCGDGYYFWSLSPDSFGDSGARVGGANGGGSVLSDYVGGSYGLRPSVSLKIASTISSGNGTAASPFVVN